MCVRWNTVLKSNGQLENTPAITSPFPPGDTVKQCPRECEPRCCNAASQAMLPEPPTHVPQGPPACRAGCPRACYPACRPGCCNAALMSPFQTSGQIYQPAFIQAAPITRPVAPFSAPQPALPVQGRSAIPQPSVTIHPTSCPESCSPVCAPNCTKHCCESYDWWSHSKRQGCSI